MPWSWTADKLRRAIEAAGVALFSWNVDTDEFTMDARSFALWGVPPAETVTFETMSERIHPQDRDRVRAAFSATRAIAGDYEIDFRLIVEEEVRWVSARGQGGDDGIVDRIMLGIFLDVTGRKQAEEGNEILAGEMSHRVKNLLTIASALTLVTQRTTESTKDMAKELTQRLAALGRAHDLVRPVPGQSENIALLGDLVSILLAPYDDLGAFEGRIRVSVPRMSVGETSATTVALILHELATNSLKYGALSNSTGTIDVSGTVKEDELVVAWTECGGPPVSVRNQKGFGSAMIERTLKQHLGGKVEYEWSDEGVVVTLTFRRTRLAK